MKEQCAEDQRPQDVDRQGRQRPRIFPNLVVEIGFCVALMLSQIMSVRPYELSPDLQPSHTMIGILHLRL